MHVQPLLEVDSSMHLFNSLRNLSIVRCDVPLFGSRGLFAALRGLPSLTSFTFEPSTAMLWAVYNNEGCTVSAKCPVGEESKLLVPDEVPKPVPYEWSSIWCAPCSFTVMHISLIPEVLPNSFVCVVDCDTVEDWCCSEFAGGSALQVFYTSN